MLAAAPRLSRHRPRRDAEARRRLRRWLLGYRLIALLLIVAAWEMTTKPAL